MSRVPDAWEEVQYPGIPLRRCPACLKAVPKQSVQCLQCWGHLLTEDGIAEIRDTKETEEMDTKSKGVTLERRTSHDVEYQIEGEIIQFPCVDVRRFRIRHKIAAIDPSAEETKEEDLDRPQGTIELIALIEPIAWNKAWRKTYGYEFPGDPRAVSCEANFA